MMTPGQFAEKIGHLPGIGVRSVILYGSAAAGDHIPRRSDYNVLVVLDKLRSEALDAVAPLTSKWMRQGNPAPLLLTLEEVKESVDVFPIEWADIKDHHVVLIGEDIVGNLEIDKEALRLQLERELRTQQIAVRSAYLRTAGHPRKMRTVMEQSLSSALVLFRSALRLFDEKPPAKKIQALPRLAERFGIQATALEVFFIVHDVKEGRRKLSRDETVVWSRRFVESLAHVTAVIDRFISRS